MDLITGERTTDAEFYPFDQEQIANAGDQVVEPLPNGVRLRVPRAPELTKLPAHLHGLIKLDDETAYEFTSPVVAGEVARSGSRTVPASAGNLTTLTALGLAFVGGIILNLMPCVFPVLFLKGLALVQSSGKSVDVCVDTVLSTRSAFWSPSGSSSRPCSFCGQAAAKPDGASSYSRLSSSPCLPWGCFFFALSLAGQFELGPLSPASAVNWPRSRATPAASLPESSRRSWPLRAQLL